MKKQFIYHDIDSIIKPLFVSFLAPFLFGIILSQFIENLVYNVLGGLGLFFIIFPIALYIITKKKNKEHLKLNVDGFFFKEKKHYDIKDIDYFDWDYTVNTGMSRARKYVIVYTKRDFKKIYDASCTGIHLNDFAIQANRYIIEEVQASKG
ncbi:hypothetical protein KMW28_23235 [Flammeovirga yaeyamensis]|uniref:YcxB-like protein domain-containing protein n=1 Tax=Flammeovirga yaeyamensis TaxID=367791 RepID=A0AAX1NCP6_9BACT|nr:hypothetical protein [Flammeovirga yaeyamensis]MBB3696717.1 hypothetical protein [Flammeovirga yaeyamensis]NMF33387.1 hypothetical protein [Flammeovirga yaeyamensis]QWG05338.1 hypothetical protein KMW28_23235 [Flammeovirga yaeyamensis]